ncbi:Pyrroline-5-carboxylate reductase [Fusarium oxysporum f. sp. albedinis]|nr:Pyrroline-5-carboxylate reductase [Fusarium oxysporum f. sp. albedinis]
MYVVASKRLLFNQDQVGNIILWTVVECGVGIVAGSFPSLRAFFKSLARYKIGRMPWSCGQVDRGVTRERNSWTG